MKRGSFSTVFATRPEKRSVGGEGPNAPRATLKNPPIQAGMDVSSIQAYPRRQTHHQTRTRRVNFRDQMAHSRTRGACFHRLPSYLLGGTPGREVVLDHTRAHCEEIQRSEFDGQDGAAAKHSLIEVRHFGALRQGHGKYREGPPPDPKQGREN